MKFLFCFLATLTLSAQVVLAQGSLQYFGYANGANDLASLTANSGYTNVAFYEAEPNTSLVTAVQQMNSYGVRAIIALDDLLWRKPGPTGCTKVPTCNNHTGGCTNGPCTCKPLVANYQTVWQNWVTRNASVLNSTDVAGFYIADEPTWNNASAADLDNATQMVHASFPSIPTMMFEASVSCAVSNLQIPFNMSWLGIDQFAIWSPSGNVNFLSNMSTLMSKMTLSRQHTIYALDAFWDSTHSDAGISQSDMATVAANWYNYASSDPNAIGLFGFIWNNFAPGEIGACCLPANVTAEHTSIGLAITGK